MAAPSLPHNQLTFREAAERWLSDRRGTISARTFRDYQQYTGTLAAQIGEILVGAISITTIRDYQKARQTAGVGNLRINHEVGCLAQVLTEAKRWYKIKPYYKRLPVSPVGPGRALSAEQARMLFELGRTSKREVALCCAILSAHTGAGPGEIRNLQLKDIDLGERWLLVRRGTKNAHRYRELPLNETAYRAVKALLERATARGATQPDHFLLPHRADNGDKNFDPTRPMWGWYRAWRGLVADAAKKDPTLAGLRPYDMRHTGATWLFSNPAVPEHVAVRMMGWSSPRMAERYFHLNREMKKHAVSAVEHVNSIATATPLQPAQISGTLALFLKSNGGGQ